MRLLVTEGKIKMTVIPYIYLNERSIFIFYLISCFNVLINIHTVSHDRISEVSSLCFNFQIIIT